MAPGLRREPRADHRPEEVRLAALGYDAPTLRHWRFYLESCAAGFAVGRTDVVQVELTHA